MTDKQKKALKSLNELWYVSHNDGLAKLRDEDYYLLVDCILVEEHVSLIPYNAPKLSCLEPDGVCTNPFHDCIGCPKHFGGGSTTITTTDDQIAKPYKHFGFDIGDPKGDIGIKEKQ